MEGERERICRERETLTSALKRTCLNANKVSYRGGVHDGQHLREVVEQGVVEECLIVVFQRSEKEVLLQRRLARVELRNAPRVLRLDGLDFRCSRRREISVGAVCKQRFLPGRSPRTRSESRSFAEKPSPARSRCQKRQRIQKPQERTSVAVRVNEDVLHLESEGSDGAAHVVAHLS